MKTTISLFLAFSLFSAQAQTLPPLVTPAPALNVKTFNAGMPLNEFLKLTISQTLQRPFVLTPAAASLEATVSADLTNVKQSDILPILKTVLESSGLLIIEVNKTFIVDKKQDVKLEKKDTEVFVFKSKHRSISELTPFFAAFSDRLEFLFSSGVQQRSTDSAGVPTGATTFSATNMNPSHLVVRGLKKDFEAFEKYITQIDVKPRNLIIRPYIYEVRRTHQNQTGLSFFIDVLNSKLSLSLGTIDQQATNAFRFSSANFTAVFQHLDSLSNVKLLTAPVVQAKSGTKANATLGSDVPTLDSVINSNGTVTQSVTYQQAGVILTVQPEIFSDSINLKITQEVSSFTATTTGVSTSPTKLRRSFESELSIKPGESLLLGGLTEIRQIKNDSRSFFLFNSKSDEESQSDIVVLLNVELAE